MPAPDVYEIFDEAGKKVGEVETNGSLSEEDHKFLFNLIKGDTSSPRVAMSDGSKTKGYSNLGGGRWKQDELAAASPVMVPYTTPAKSPKPGVLDGITNGLTKLGEGTGKVGEGLINLALGTADTAKEGAGIGLDMLKTLFIGVPGSPLYRGGPVVNQQELGNRMGDFAIANSVPFPGEIEGAIGGTEQNPKGGLPAFGEVLGANWKRDPVAVLANALAVLHMAKSPLAKSLDANSRSLMASGDLSAPARQGLTLSVAHPGLAVNAAEDMLKAGRSQAGASVASAALKNRATAPIHERFGLAVGGKGGNEFFQGNYVKEVPFLGPLVKASDRAYDGYLHRLRADVFDNAMKHLESQGLSPDTAPQVYADLAEWVNTASGHGRLSKAEKWQPAPEVPVKPAKVEAPAPVPAHASGPPPLFSEMGDVHVLTNSPGANAASLKRALEEPTQTPTWPLASLGAAGKPSPESVAPALAAAQTKEAARGLAKLGPAVQSVLFAPRLQASRLMMMNPMYYTKLSAPVRKMALADLAKSVTAGMATLGMAKISGASVGTDPDKSDFGKIVLADGQTRYDIWGGARPWARLVAQVLISGQAQGKAAAKGDMEGMEGAAAYRGDALGKRARSIASPLASLALDAMNGSTLNGKKFDLTDAVTSRSVSLFLQDLKNAIEKQGVIGALKVAPAALGVGVEMYDKK